MPTRKKIPLITADATLAIAAAKTATFNQDFTATGAAMTLTGSGTNTYTFPASTATLASLGLAETITGAKTFGAAGNVGKLILAGSTSGTSILNAAAVAGTTTITLPGVTSTLAILGANTFTGDQALGANNLTMTGSIAATGARVTKGWFTDVESTNMITVGGTSLSSTFAAIAQTMYIGTTAVAINRASAALTLAGITLTTPDIGTPSAGTLTNCTGLPVAGITASTATAIGVGSIELGHATDTTIARSGAGDITIEGNAVYRAGGTDVPVTDGGTGASTAAGAASNLGLGTEDNVQFNGLVVQRGDDTGHSSVEFYHIGNTYSNFFTAYRARASTAIVASGDTLFFVAGKGYDGANYRTAAYFTIEVDGTPGIDDMPGRIVFYTTPDGSIYGTEVLRLNSAQQIIALPTYSVTVGATNRDLFIDNTGLIGYVSSSIRYKENINDFDSSRIYNLRPVSYNYKSDKTQTIQYGLIAEEVEKVMPELVSYDKEGKPETVGYTQLIPCLLNEIKKLNQRLEILEAKK